MCACRGCLSRRRSLQKAKFGVLLGKHFPLRVARSKASENPPLEKPRISRPSTSPRAQVFKMTLLAVLGNDRFCTSKHENCAQRAASRQVLRFAPLLRAFGGELETGTVGKVSKTLSGHSSARVCEAAKERCEIKCHGARMSEKTEPPRATSSRAVWRVITRVHLNLLIDIIEWNGKKWIKNFLGFPGYPVDFTDGPN